MLAALGLGLGLGYILLYGIYSAFKSMMLGAQMQPKLKTLLSSPSQSVYTNPDADLQRIIYWVNIYVNVC